jgi:MFS family permease
MIVVESYPNEIRTTGFGWAFGVGRIGATTAPLFAGMLVEWSWSSGEIFAAAAVPGIVSAVALMGIAVLLRQRRQHMGGDGAKASGMGQPIPSAH